MQENACDVKVNHKQTLLVDQRSFPQNEYRELIVSLRENPELRTIGVAAIDTSGSMAESSANQGNSAIKPIEEANKSLIMMKEAFLMNRYAARQIMVSIVTFGGIVHEAVKMTPATNFIPPTLVANGLTHLAEGVLHMLMMIKYVIALLLAEGVDFNPVSVLILSDGAPTSNQEMLAAMSKEFSAMYRKKLIHPIIVVTETGDAQRLEELFGVKPIRLNMLRMRDLFLWFSQSLETVSMECFAPDEFTFANPYEAEWSQDNDN